MFGLMLKSKHNRIEAELRGRIERQKSTIVTLQTEITQDNAKIVELGNALNDEKKNTSKLRELTKMQNNSLDILSSRILNAVEGLSARDTDILRAKVDGNYIYTVYWGVMKADVVVPMDNKNFDRTAKKLAAKEFGLTSRNIAQLKAERWVI